MDGWTADENIYKYVDTSNPTLPTFILFALFLNIKDYPEDCLYGFVCYILHNSYHEQKYLDSLVTYYSFPLLLL